MGCTYLSLSMRCMEVEFGLAIRQEGSMHGDLSILSKMHPTAMLLKIHDSRSSGCDRHKSAMLGTVFPPGTQLIGMDTGEHISVVYCSHVDFYRDDVRTGSNFKPG